MELDICQVNNEHPNTGTQLTRDGIRNIPWLAPAKASEGDDDDGDDHDDVVVVVEIINTRTMSGPSNPLD